MIDEWIDGFIDGSMDGYGGQMSGRVNGWVGAQVDGFGRVSAWMDCWIDEINCYYKMLDLSHHVSRHVVLTSSVRGIRTSFGRLDFDGCRRLAQKQTENQRIRETYREPAHQRNRQGTSASSPDATNDIKRHLVCYSFMLRVTRSNRAPSQHMLIIQHSPHRVTEEDTDRRTREDKTERQWNKHKNTLANMRTYE